MNGVYLTSEGHEGSGGVGHAWHAGARCRAPSGDEPVSIAIFDHPRNPGYPTYWHARGYGLFAANPLGQKALSNGKDVLNFAIEPRQAATFRYRIVIANAAMPAADVEAAWTAWSSRATEASPESRRPVAR